MEITLFSLIALSYAFQIIMTIMITIRLILMAHDYLYDNHKLYYQLLLSVNNYLNNFSEELIGYMFD